MNDDLLSKIKTERNAWAEAAAQHLRNEEYYKGLLIQIGEMLGHKAYISDDGTVHDHVLCAKVPELIKELINELDSRNY